MPHVDVLIDLVTVDQPVRLEQGPHGIVVFRSKDEVVAYEDACPHAGWRLSAGEIIDGRLECPGHGWEFDVATGQCLSVPTYCLRRLRVEPVDRTAVRIEWEDAPMDARMTIR